MKKIYFISFLVFPFSLIAQKKVDLDRFYFTTQFRSLPKMKIDSTYRTYNVVVEGSKLMQPFLQNLDPEKNVLIEGWKKLSDNGHLTIKIYLEDLLPATYAVKERIENIKNSKGEVTGTRTLYCQEVVYTFAATANISDYKGIHIMDQVLADRNYKQVYKSPEFALRTMAEAYFMLNAVNITGDLYRNCVNRAMHYLTERITDNFGFNPVTVRDQMWIVGSRKHPEYAAHRQAFQQLNNILFDMTAQKPIHEMKEQLKPAIEYFEKIKRKYTSTSKHDRKIRYASFYNLAVLHYYLDDPQRMMKEANGLVLNDFDTKDGKSFEQSAIRLKNLFQQNNIYTRHFEIDTSAFKGPYEKNEMTVK
jgi:hypothetical protein